jgi:hypothetical protein
MMQEFTTLYTDIAYALSEHNEKPGIHNALIQDILNPKFKNRIMFGTDYFLTECEDEEMHTYESFMEDAKSTPPGTARDMAAHSSIEQFLYSKYF